MSVTGGAGGVTDCCVFSPTAFILVVCTHMRSRDIRSLIHSWASAYTTSSTHTLLTTIAVTDRIGIVFCDNVNKLMMRVYYFLLIGSLAMAVTS